MKKILIVGESNSVMKGGWVSGFSSNFDDDVVIVNRSIGSTGVLNVIHQLLEVGDEIKEFDAILLEHLVNDVKFYIDNKDDYFNWLDCLYSALVSSGISVMVVAYSRHDLDFEGNAFLAEILEFFKTKEINVYDVSFKLNNIKGSRRASKVSELYKDSAHPLPAVSYEIGIDIAGFFSDFGELRYLIKPFVLPFSLFNIDFFNCNNQVGHDFVKNIKNSIVDYQLVDLQEDVPLCWEVPCKFRGWSVIGFMFNSSSANGFLSFVSSGHQFDKLVSNANYVKENPVLWARPVHSEFLLGGDLKVEVKTQSSDYEKTEFCNAKYTIPKMGRIEIVSLILANK